MMTLDTALQLGLEHHRAGRLQDATHIYQTILQQHPTLWQVCFLLGSAKLQSSDYSTAEYWLSKAVSGYPIEGRWHNELGDAQRLSGQFAAAITPYRQAVTLSPELLDAWDNLAFCLAESGHSLEAEQVWKDMATRHPNSPRPFYGAACFYIGKGNVEAARACLAQAIRLDQSQNSAALGMDPAAALNQLVAVAHIFPEREWAQNNNYPFHTFIHSKESTENDITRDNLNVFGLDRPVELRDTTMVHARNAHIIGFNWSSPAGGSDTNYYIFSERWSYVYSENNIYLHIFARHSLSFFRYLSPGDKISIINFNMTHYRSLKFYGDCIFVGSKQNFGHWLFDFLARLYYLPHDQIAGKKFVFGKLSAFQKECLPYFGIDLDQIVEMDQEDLPVRVASDYFFEHLTLLPVPPKLIAATFLHQRFVRDRHSAGPRRVYLSRGRYRPRHRVENEDEIVAFLQSQGFHICYPETLTVRQLIETLSNAEIVVTPYGATAANIIFCPQDTISIILLTDSWNEPIEVRNLENLRPYASYGYRAIRVQGKAVNRVHGFCLEENGIYALNDIAAALQTAQAMHANTRPPDPEPLP